MDADRITTIIVDTCVYRDENSDFLGINKQLLPSFFTTAKDKGITLLKHPVLDKEVYKHIENSSLCKNYNHLVEDIEKCNSTLKYLELDQEEALKKITSVNMKDKLYNAYQKHYEDAIFLDYGNPEKVFELYFKGEAPFGTGKKKHEFPDAFVIDAIKSYINQHPNDILLVVSRDADWINAFKGNDSVIICDKLEDAQVKISNIDSILSSETVDEIFKSVYMDILTEAHFHIESECFELEDYEGFETLEIDTLIVENAAYSFTPLKITRDHILVSTEITAKVWGHAEVIDLENSLWDNVDQEYIYVRHADIEFSGAEVKVECEILISIDFDNPIDFAQLEEVKLLNQDNICIDCKDLSVTYLDDDEMALRCLREDKGYPRRE